MRLVLSCLYWSSFLHQFSVASFIDITRRTEGDVFTINQVNDTWCGDDCSSYGGDCSTPEESNCCKYCQCRGNQTSYVRQINQCIPSKRLTSVLFRDMSQGCSYRLVANGFKDRQPRGSKPCDFTDLTLLALDQGVSGSQLIDVCGIFTWSISSCEVMSGAYYDRGHWKDLWNAGSNQAIFSIEKRLGVAIHFKWDSSLSSRYYGYILSLDVRCKRKYGRKDVDSCLVFKVKGTQMDKRPSTPRPTNYTATPTVIERQSVPESSVTSLMLIVVGVICGLFALLLFCLIVCCLWKRKGIHNSLWRKRKGKPKAKKQEADSSSDHPVDAAMTTSSPLYDVNEYQCVNNHEPPVYTTYTTPDNADYQDLMIAKPTYEPLFTKTCDSPESPMYYTLEEPGNNNNQNDVTSHEYHVLEVP